MITELTKVLQAADLTLSVDELTDALWLAVQLADTLPEKDSSLRAPTIAAPQQEHQPSSINDTSRAPSHGDRHPDVIPPVSEQPQHVPVYPTPATAPTTIDLRGFAAETLQVPAATALPDKLAIGRALRPFKQPVDSRVRYEIDEEATAMGMAEQHRLPTIIRCPARERWLDVALVIDQSPSMQLWQHAIHAWQRLLEQHGAFRVIRLWHIHNNTWHQHPFLSVGTAVKPSIAPSRSYRELIDPARRRLILVMSDCVGPAWYDGTMLDLIRAWGQENHVSIVQMLAPRLWSRSGLCNGMATSITIPMPVAPNRQLRAIEGSVYGLCVPVTTLDATALTNWAACVTGYTDQTPGYLFEAGYETLEPAPSVQTLTAQARVDRFWHATPDRVRRLAGLLAFLPLTPPVIRLVQQTMFPVHQRHVMDITEVLLGGLAYQVKANDPITDPDNLQFEFVAGVRDALIITRPITEHVQVVREISRYIAEQTGKPSVFQALLDASTTDSDLSLFVPEESRPFARLTAQLLYKLGGKYATIAEQLDVSTVQSSVPDLQQGAVTTPVSVAPVSVSLQQTLAELEATLRLSLPDSVRQIIEDEVAQSHFHKSQESESSQTDQQDLTDTDLARIEDSLVLAPRELHVEVRDSRVSTVTTVEQMSIHDLGQRCTEETHKFNRRLDYDSQYCFELFRRALGETNAEALAFIFQIYHRQVISWVYSHGSFQQTGEEAEFFVHQAMTNFYFALRGEQIYRFTSLAQLLSYLKACTHTTIMQYIRDQKVDMNRSIDGIAEQSFMPNLNTGLHLEELWERIETLLPEPRDQVLARCILTRGLKPSEIVQDFPHLWKTEREVSVATFRIRRILRRDGILRRWYEDNNEKDNSDLGNT